MKNTKDLILDANGVSDGWQTTYEYKEVQRLMKEYAKELMDHILTRGDLIRVIDEPTEAVYVYDGWLKLRDSLK